MINLTGDSAIITSQLTFAIIVILLIALQILVLKRDFRFLRYLTYLGIVLTVGGIAFGKYYASAAPARLRATEISKPLDAVRSYTQAMRLNPGDSELLFGRGRADFNAREFSTAANDFTAALMLSPNNPKYLVARAAAFVFLGQWDSAEADMRKAARSGYRSPEMSIIQGAIADKRGRLDEATARYAEALSSPLVIFEDRCSTRLSRGVDYLQQRQYASAMNDFTWVIENCGAWRESALVDRAAARSLSGDNSGAFADWDAALRLAPEDPLIFQNRGAARAHLGQLGLALSDYTHYLALRPDDAYMFLSRASVYAQIGDLTHAASDRERANAIVTARGGSYSPNATALPDVRTAPYL